MDNKDSKNKTKTTSSTTSKSKSAMSNAATKSKAAMSSAAAKSKSTAAKSKNLITKNPISKGLFFLIKAVISQWKVLLTITAIFMIIVVILGGITYGFEQVNNNDDFTGTFTGSDGEFTFLDSLWWVYVTISTIGYGDIYPISGWMRIWAVVISLIGMSFIALYTAVVVNGFTKQLQLNREDAGVMSELKEQENLLEDEVAKLKEENLKLKKQIKDLKNKTN